MTYLIAYYVIGVVVSLYMIYYYRHSVKTKRSASKNDAILAIIGPWIFPVQIVKHLIYLRELRKENEKVR